MKWELLTLSCHRDGGNDQWQDGGDNTQDTSEGWGNVGTERGNGLQDWLLVATGESALALGTGDTTICTGGEELDRGSSKASSGERKGSDDFGELHFDGFLRGGEVKIEVNVYV